MNIIKMKGIHLHMDIPNKVKIRVKFCLIETAQELSICWSNLLKKVRKV